MGNLVATRLPDLLAEDQNEGMRYLIGALRSGAPVPPDLAILLADMLDPRARSEWRLKFEKRGAGPVKRRHRAQSTRDALQYLRDEAIEKKRPLKVVIAEATDRFGFAKTKLYDLHKEARDLDQNLLEEIGDAP